MGIKEDITKIYIGYYDRAPDPAGLNYWISRANAGMTLPEIAASFAVQPESTAKYPYLANPLVVSADSFITNIYQNLFNRAPDDAGKAHWLAELAGGKAVGQMIIDIISGATDSDAGKDATIMANKIKAGVDFAEKAGNVLGLDYENNPAAKAAAAEVLNGVDDTDASVTEAIAETDAFIASNPVTGETMTLTNGTDAGADFTGGDGNDLFVAGPGSSGADDHTLGNGDVLVGGAGKDTLRITTGDSEANSSPTLTGIEVIDARTPTGSNVNLDLSNSTGVTDVLFTNLNGWVGFQNVGSEVGMHAVSNNSNGGTLQVDYSASADVGGDLNFFANGASGVHFQVNSAQSAFDVQTVNVDSSGMDSIVSLGINDGGGAAPEPTTLNVTGDAGIELWANDNVQRELTTVNVTNTGGALIDLDENDADITVTGGSGDDIFRFDDDRFDGDDTVDGGEGEDKVSIRLDGNTDMTSVDVDDAPDHDLVLALNNTTNVEMAEFRANGDVSLDASFFTSIDHFTVRGGTIDDVSVENAENDDTFVLRNADVDVATFEAHEDADTLSLEVDTAHLINQLHANGFDTVNVDITTDSSNQHIGNLNVDDDTEVTLTGTVDDGILNIGSFTGEDAVLDASGLDTDNGNLFHGSDEAQTIIGTEQHDMIDGHGGDDTIIGGDGDDWLIGGSATTPAANGVATIDLNALNDLDADNDTVNDNLDGISVEVNGTVYSASAGTLNGIGTVLAGLLDGVAGIESVSVAGGVITITSTTTTAPALDDLSALLTPADRTNDTTGTHTAETTDATPATPGVSTITIDGSSVAVNDVIDFEFDDGDGGDTITVSYTVLASDIGVDDTATGENVASGLLAAIDAESTFALAAGNESASRSGNVVTITSLNAGGTGDNENIQATETVDGSGIATVANTPGTDAIVDSDDEVYNFNDYVSEVDGSLEVTVDGVTATIAVTGGVDVTGNAIEDAIAAVNGADQLTSAGTDLEFGTDSDTVAPVITSTFTATQTAVAQDDTQLGATDGVATTTFGQDTLTGGDGDDIFGVQADGDIVVGMSNDDIADAVDIITDFVDGDDVIDFTKFDVDGTDSNYSEGAVNGYGNVVGALAAAQSEFDADATLRYSAQQVGDDVFIFADSDGNHSVDEAVQLTGVTLADLSNDGSFIIDMV